jgi:hypothetical protein
MDFFQTIDIYCERTDPSFWAEPVNAITNAAFLIAAYVLYRAYRQTYRPTGQRDWPSIVLIALIAVIGVGSFLFHSFANNWSMLADVIPIALFIWFYLFAFLRRFATTRWVVVIAAYAAFAALNWAIANYVPGEMVNNSQSYFPALIAMALMGGYLFHQSVRNSPSPLGEAETMGVHRFRGGAPSEPPPEGGGEWRYYALAVMAFTASLIFRTLDPLVCAEIALGTHFLWHILNAVTLYLVARAVMPIRAGT